MAKLNYSCKYCGNKIGSISALYNRGLCKICGHRKYFISKSKLYKYYIIKNKSILELAKKYKCNYGTIYKWLLKYGIRIKTRIETHLGRKRPNQSKRMLGSNNPMYGKQRSKRVRKLISIKAKNRLKDPRNHPMFGKKFSYKCSFGRGGRYKKSWMRSSYEIAYAKYLTKKHIKWQYEPKAFDLGNCTYRPDFYLLDTDKYIEIKGYWLPEAKVKFKLFKSKYPNIKILILDKEGLKRRGINVK